MFFSHQNEGVTGQRGEITPTALGTQFKTCSQTTITSRGRGYLFWAVCHFNFFFIYKMLKTKT